MAKLPWAVAILLLCLTALSFVSACTVDSSFLDESGLFFCESDADCEPGYKCELSKQECQIEGPPMKVECEDKDEDGYGVGDNRLECDKDEEDTDDTDKSIYPGAPDLCDGKDNDSDPNTPDGQLSCGNAGDCPQDAAIEDTFFFCEGSVCVLKPSIASSELCRMPLTCNNGAYDPVPEECKKN